MKFDFLFRDVLSPFKRSVPGRRDSGGHIKWDGPIYLRSWVWRTELMYVLNQLSAIVRCNAPLVPALEMAAYDAPRHRLFRVLHTLRDDVSLGQSVSDAMGNRPGFFPGYIVDLVRAGESTGSLKQALQWGTEHIRRENDTKRTIRGWVTYVTIILLIQAMLFMFLFSYVIPEFNAILEEFGATASYAVKATTYLGDLLRTPSTLMIALLLLFIVLVPHNLLPFSTARAGRRVSLFKALALRIPLVGRHFRKIHLAHVASVLSLLLRARVPLTEALHDCANSEIDGRMRNALSRVREKVAEGHKFVDTLRAESIFPESFCSAAAVGEASGLMSESFDQLAAIYERQNARTARVIVDMTMPLIVLICGAFGLAIQLAVFTSTVGIAESLINSM